MAATSRGGRAREWPEQRLVINPARHFIKINSTMGIDYHVSPKHKIRGEDL